MLLLAFAPSFSLVCLIEMAANSKRMVPRQDPIPIIAMSDSPSSPRSGPTNQSAAVKLTEDQKRYALEFSRHYDNLLWVVTTVMTSANAALLAIAGGQLTVQSGVLGLSLPVLTVFFAASFRRLRLRIHDKLERDSPGEHRWLYSGHAGWASQWKAYVGFFAAMSGLWASLLFDKFPAHRFLWGAATTICAGLFALFYQLARRHTPEDSNGS